MHMSCNVLYGQVAVQICEQVKHLNESKFHVSDDSSCINRPIAYEIDLSRY
jgi:hypothetical protein